MPIEYLSFKSVTKKYGDFKALDGLSFKIEKEKIFGFIGPNGAGKTTSINCMSGLLDIDSGTIEVFGKNLKTNSIYVKKNIGVLFENMNDLYAYLTGQEHLEFVGQVYNMPNEIIFKRIDSLFQFFEMESHRHILIDDYSKGIKKKLALASILLHNPNLIILDEPFEGLDTITIIKMKNLLTKLKHLGRTIFISSHLLYYLEDLCDEVAIIHKGKIIYQNKIEKIKTEFKNHAYKNMRGSELEEIFLKTLNNKSQYLETLDWL
jgi:ABC-2 type transport system ATP-binding protein